MPYAHDVVTVRVNGSALCSANAMASSWSSRQPGRPNHDRANPRRANATASGDPTIGLLPFVGSPSAHSMVASAHRNTSPISPACALIPMAPNPAWAVRAGSPIESSSAISSDASRCASRGSPRCACSASGPMIPNASEVLSPASAHNSRSSSKRSLESSAWTRQSVAHSAVRGAMRIAVAVGEVVGQCIGNLAGTLPADPSRSRIAVVQPRACAHVPVECGAQIGRCLQVLGDQRRLLVNRTRTALFDRALATRRCNSARSDLSWAS